MRELDQDARGALRKHRVRFGQFTIFFPALLKPAPTRLRLVLWSLQKGFDVFPESPPPGLVTIPWCRTCRPGPTRWRATAPAGQRAIRIDMLERLADMLRACDTRGGFEATADMLSISGLSLDQFADLLGGLGYRAEKGERPKQRPVPATQPAPAPDAAAAEAPNPASAAASDSGARGRYARRTAGPPPTPRPSRHVRTGDRRPGKFCASQPAAEAGCFDAGEPRPPKRHARRRPAAGSEQDAPVTAEPESEVFYTFTWVGNRRRGGTAPARAAAGPGKPRAEDGGKPKGEPQTRGKGPARTARRAAPSPKGDKPKPTRPKSRARTSPSTRTTRSRPR